MAKVRVNWGAADGCSVSLFEVFNTAHKRLYVLARDSKTAMSVAHTANHVYSPVQKHAESYSRAAYQVTASNPQIAVHWELIQHAIAQRLEGTVHLEEFGISVGHQRVGK